MLRADVGDIMICMPEVDLDAARGQKKADPANHGEVEPSIGFFSVVSPSSTLHTLFGFFSPSINSALPFFSSGGP